MDAWPAPELPVLPGRGAPPRVHDTASGGLRSTAQRQTARLYVCGITPYDATHIGHAATYVAFDLLQRLWRDAGREVRYVQNVTDVDDPLLERAAEIGEPWEELAIRETALFREDMTALRLVPPDHYVGAVEAIPLILGMVERLGEQGALYPVDGDLYFQVSGARGFGDVSGLTRDEMFPLFKEFGGDPDRAGKRHPFDDLVWRAERPGEPAWPSPFGRGRPGWHIECAAIAESHLGMDFDVQGGGSDLVFPHHEMGAAEARVAEGGHTFARAYVHAGMVGFDGEKMSKSKGNLVLVSKLRRDGVDPMAVRLAILDRHYRADWEWTRATLDAAVGRLARWRAAVSRPDGPPAEALIAEIREHLARDLDAPAAVAAVDRWAERQEALGGADEAAPGLVSRAVDALLGVAL